VLHQVRATEEEADRRYREREERKLAKLLEQQRREEEERAMVVETPAPKSSKKKKAKGRAKAKAETDKAETDKAETVKVEAEQVQAPAPRSGDVATLMEMGFSEPEVVRALADGGTIQEALERLFTSGEGLDDGDPSLEAADAPPHASPEAPPEAPPQQPPSQAPPAVPASTPPRTSDEKDVSASAVPRDAPVPSMEEEESRGVSREAEESRGVSDFDHMDDAAILAACLQSTWSSVPDADTMTKGVAGDTGPQGMFGGGGQPGPEGPPGIMGYAEPPASVPNQGLGLGNLMGYSFGLQQGFSNVPDPAQSTESPVGGSVFQGDTGQYARVSGDTGHYAQVSNAAASRTRVRTVYNPPRVPRPYDPFAQTHNAPAHTLNPQPQNYYAAQTHTAPTPQTQSVPTRAPFYAAQTQNTYQTHNAPAYTQTPNAGSGPPYYASAQTHTETQNARTSAPYYSAQPHNAPAYTLNPQARNAPASYASAPPTQNAPASYAAAPRTQNAPLYEATPSPVSEANQPVRGVARAAARPEAQHYVPRPRREQQRVAPGTMAETTASSAYPAAAAKPKTVPMCKFAGRAASGGRPGGCRFGDACKFRHVPDNPPPSVALSPMDNTAPYADTNRPAATYGHAQPERQPADGGGKLGTGKPTAPSTSSRGRRANQR